MNGALRHRPASRRGHLLTAAAVAALMAMVVTAAWLLGSVLAPTASDAAAARSDAAQSAYADARSEARDAAYADAWSAAYAAGQVEGRQAGANAGAAAARRAAARTVSGG